MFLTRFHLDPRSPAGSRALRNPQRMHAIVAAATSGRSAPDGALPPPGPAPSRGRTLWRLDQDDPASPLLWVVSIARPDFDEIAGEAGKVVAGVVYETRPYEALLDRLEAGQVYAFRLAANAVRSGRRSPESPATQRFGHVTVAQQLSWLEARSDVHGFSLRKSITGEPDAAIVGRRRLAFSRQGQRVTIAVSEFMGHLEVSDPDRLRRSLATGIGHGRAYGCGLLTVAAPRRT